MKLFHSLLLVVGWPARVLSTADNFGKLASLPGYAPSDFSPDKLSPYQANASVRAGENTAVPLEYNVTIIPGKGAKDFLGSARIRFRADMDSNNLTLQIEEFSYIKVAFFRLNGSSNAIKALDKHERYINILFLNNFKKAEIYDLLIKYKGKISSDGTKGGLVLSKGRRKSRRSSVLYTAFGVEDVRRVFPCTYSPFTESSFNLKLVHPGSHTAFSSTQISKHETNEDDQRTTSFSRVTGIAPHQVSFAILDGYDNVTVNFRGFQMDGYFPKGGKSKSEFEKALTSIGVTLDQLQDFFRFPLPYKIISVVFAKLSKATAKNKQSSGLLILDSSDITSSSYSYGLTRKSIDLWLGTIGSSNSLKNLWIKEAILVWLTDCILDKVPTSSSEPYPSFIDNREHVMALDFLDGRATLNFPSGQYESGGHSFSSKCLILMYTLEKYLGRDKLISGIREYISKNTNLTTNGESFVDVLSRVSSKPVSDIIDPWTQIGGLPVVKITERNGSEIAVELSLQGMQGNHTKNSIVPVYANFYLGNDHYQSVLLKERKNVIKLDIDSAPFVVLDTRPNYTYYRPSYSDEYLREVAGKTHGSTALSKEEKIRLFESLIASPSSALILANEWKDDESSRLLVIRGLYMICPLFVRKMKKIYFEIRKVQRDIVERHMIGLNFPILRPSSDLRIDWTAFSNIEKWDEDKISALNEACILGVPSYRHICIYLLVQNMNQGILPDVLAFGAYKEAIRTEPLDSDSYDTVYSILEDRGRPFAHRIAAGKALGANEDESYANIEHAMDKVSSQIERRLLFPPMLETMKSYPAPSRVSWKWLKKNWDSQIKRFPSFRKAVVLSGVPGNIRKKKFNDVCQFFSKKPILSLMERLAINHKIATSTYMEILARSEKKKLNAFFKSYEYLTGNSSDVNMKDKTKTVKANLRPESIIQEYGDSLSCQIPIYD